jgi:hypothetical protein
MKSSFVESAIKRVEGYLNSYDTAQPAEIIADILHYCERHSIDFAEETRLAEGYVQEEISLGEEFFG